MKMTIRADKSRMELSGYVNGVDRESRVLRDVSGAFLEKVAPGTFADALNSGEAVDLMFNHRRSVERESLTLREDAIGLHADAVITDREVIDAAENGMLTGWSFGFYAKSDNWETDADGMRHRTLTGIDLKEVSILTGTPAYIATTVECRASDNAKVIEYNTIEEAPEVIEYRAEQEDKPDEPPEPVPVPEDMPDSPPPEDVPDEPPTRTYDAYKAFLKSI